MVRCGPRFERKSLPKPWDEVVRAVMRYVTLEGHYKTIYAYHFSLLNHFKHEITINFPFFIHHSLKLSILKCKQTQNKIPRHQGVIKLVYEVVLANNQLGPLTFKSMMKMRILPLLCSLLENRVV